MAKRIADVGAVPRRIRPTLLILRGIALFLMVGSVLALIHLSLTSPLQEAESDGLHRDDFIRQLAPHDIDATTRAARSLFDLPCLDVAPNGETRSRAEVFRALGLDDRRVGDLRRTHIGHCVFLWWRVSPSYDLVCMTGDGEWEEKPPPAEDAPERQVYGVRLVSRADAGVPWGSGWSQPH